MIAVCDDILTWFDLKVTADEIERLRFTNATLVREGDKEIQRLRALVKKAGDLLTYGAPDKELQSDDGSDWIDQCDEWFRAAGYGAPRAADETSDG
jgi:hypothetical protein